MGYVFVTMKLNIPMTKREMMARIWAVRGACIGKQWVKVIQRRPIDNASKADQIRVV